MNEQELKELLTLVRGIEHFILRCLKTIENTRSLEAQGVVIEEDKWEQMWNGTDSSNNTTEFEL